MSEISLPEFDAMMKTSFWLKEKKKERDFIVLSLCTFYSTAEAIIVKAGKRKKEQFHLSRWLFAFAVSFSLHFPP